MKVSVIIPVYNAEATIAPAIESALAQQFDGFEIVVVDDGSTDCSPRIVEFYVPKIRVVREPNRGCPSARNAGAAVARGEHLAFLDADDEWTPDKLAKTVAALERNPAAVLAYSDFTIIHDHGEEEPFTAGAPPSMKEMLTGDRIIMPSTVVMRRSAFDACGKFDETFRFGFEDLEMWLRARAIGEFVYVPEPLMRYRVTDFSERADKYEPGRRMFIQIIRRRYGRAVAPFITQVNRDAAASLIQKALRQIDADEPGMALVTLGRAARIRPSYLLRASILKRLARPRNLKRLGKVTSAWMRFWTPVANDRRVARVCSGEGCASRSPLKVSAIIPVYNGEATIARAIESALAQQFEGFEIVVVDDGSTDSSPRVIESYVSKIRVVRQANRGLGSARNAGAAVARGEYLAFLDADDEWLPEKLAKTIAALERNLAAVLAYSDFTGIDKDGEETSFSAGAPRSMNEMLSGGGIIMPSTVVMRRAVFEACGRFDEAFRLAFEDIELWLRARERGEFVYVPEPLLRYRMTDFAERADRDEEGRQVFIPMVRRRYGRAVAPLIAQVNRDAAASLIQKACRQIDSGGPEMALALGTLGRSVRIRPSYLLRPSLLKRLVRPHNLKRLGKVTLSRMRFWTTYSER